MNTSAAVVWQHGRSRKFIYANKATRWRHMHIYKEHICSQWKDILHIICITVSRFADGSHLLWESSGVAKNESMLMSSHKSHDWTLNVHWTISFLFHKCGNWIGIILWGSTCSDGRWECYCGRAWKPIWWKPFVTNSNDIFGEVMPPFVPPCFIITFHLIRSGRAKSFYFITSCTITCHAIPYHRDSSCTLV